MEADVQLRQGIVVDTHPEDYSVDLVMLDDGSRIVGAQVMTMNGSARAGSVDLPYVGKKKDKWDLSERTDNEMTAVVATMRGHPVVVGFLYPQISQMTFDDPERSMHRHQSDFYQTVNSKGEMEIHHPSGTFIRIASNTKHEDLSSKNFDKNFKPERNKGHKVSIHLETAEGKSKITVDERGAVAIEAKNAVTIKGSSISLSAPTTSISGNLTVGGSTKIGGSLNVGGSVTSGGSMASGGKISARGGLSASGTLSATGDVIAGGGVFAAEDVIAGDVALRGHQHPGVEPGKAKTEPADPNAVPPPPDENLETPEKNPTKQKPFNGEKPTITTNDRGQLVAVYKDGTTYPVDKFGNTIYELTGFQYYVLGVGMVFEGNVYYIQATGETITTVGINGPIISTPQTGEIIYTDAFGNPLDGFLGNPTDPFTENPFPDNLGAHDMSGYTG